MTSLRTDVLICGSGFGGSLTSLVLQKIGCRCVMVDRAKHPRFAIGESSTPLADFVLRDLARRYELPMLSPLTSWGSWRSTYPELRCGLKRGFSYFAHRPDQEFETDDNGLNQLLVAASSTDAESDTHWYRSDIDRFVFELARAEGVECFEDSEVVRIEADRPWQVVFRDANTERTVHAHWIVDASGPGGVLVKRLGLEDQTGLLRTNTRAMYGHFTDVDRFADVLKEQGFATTSHPFACDAAALHHVLEDSWMWNLRFHDGLVSAGFVTTHRRDRESRLDWDAQIARYPSIGRQFRRARPDPSVGLRRTGRLQRLLVPAAGDGWFALPHTAGFIDPMHSTGLAHTLTAVERLVGIIAEDCPPDAVADYGRAICEELRFVDELVAGCYRGLSDFRLFRAWCLLYFIATIRSEQVRLTARTGTSSFLAADCEPLRVAVRTLRDPFRKAVLGDLSIKALMSRMRNTVGVLDAVGMYSAESQSFFEHTATR